jgi:hypothetical protein
MVTAGYSAEMSISIPKGSFDTNGQVEVKVHVESYTTVNVTLQYYIENESGTVYKIIERKDDLRGSKNYNKRIPLNNTPPGYYNLTVIATIGEEELNDSGTFRVTSDCVEFTGLSNVYAIESLAQDCVFDLVNHCLYDLHDVRITFLNYDSIVGNISNNLTVRLRNVVSPSKSKNVRIDADYDEGSSHGLVEFIIQTEDEINDLIDELSSNTELLVNKSKGNIALVVVGDKQEMADYHNHGVDLINLALQERASNNYALAVKYLLESIEFLRKSNNLSSSSITQQVMLIIILSVVFLSIITLFVYNKYRYALKMKQLEELGKS